MKYLLTVVLIVITGTFSFSQKYNAKSSSVRFFSSAPLEDIEATTTTARSIIDLSKGEFVFIVKIKDFKFDKSLMQEHFNENYMESDKYPEATFSGKILDWSDEKGKKEVIAKGDLKVHGISKEVEIKSTIDYQDDKVTIASVFPIRLVDHKIKIPKAVFYNIAEELEVTIQFDYEAL